MIIKVVVYVDVHNTKIRDRDEKSKYVDKCGHSGNRTHKDYLQGSPPAFGIWPICSPRRNRTCHFPPCKGGTLPTSSRAMSPEMGSNHRPLSYQDTALPLSYPALLTIRDLNPSPPRYERVALTI